MTFMRSLGKKPARLDHRLPHLSRHTVGLGAPPDNINWYAKIGEWEMLGNDRVGNCTVAGAMHNCMQGSSYAENVIAPTAAEAIANYSAIGGYIPGNESTDQGLYMLGPGSLTEFWISKGLLCGGSRNFASAVMQITKPDPIEWRQALQHFGGVLLGIQLPESIVATQDAPFVWSDPSGSVAGGHEIYCVGAQLTGGERLYDIISWGSRYRCTEEFLLATVDEAVTVLNPAFMNAQGIDPAGFNLASLQADMDALRATV